MNNKEGSKPACLTYALDSLFWLTLQFQSKLRFFLIQNIFESIFSIWTMNKSVTAEQHPNACKDSGGIIVETELKTSDS